MENQKNNKKVLLFSIVLIVAAYFVLDKLTRNYFNHHEMPKLDCSTITSGNPDEVAECAQKREKEEAELNHDANYLSKPNFSMKLKLIFDGKTEELIGEKGTHSADNFLYFKRQDTLGLVYCSANIPSFNLTKVYLRLIPSKKNIVISCLDKISKKPVFFGDSSLSNEEIIKEGTASLGDYSKINLDELVEF